MRIVAIKGAHIKLESSLNHDATSSAGVPHSLHPSCFEGVLFPVSGIVTHHPDQNMKYQTPTLTDVAKQVSEQEAFSERAGAHVGGRGSETFHESEV